MKLLSTAAFYTIVSTVYGSKRLSVTPVQKVVQLLENLQQQVKDEGVSESANYEKFSCFCKNETSATKGWIESGKTELSNLATAIESGSMHAEKLAFEIQEHKKKVETDSIELENMKRERAAALAVYEERHGELVKGLDALGRAKAHVASTNAADQADVFVEIKQLSKAYLPPDYTDRVPGKDKDAVYDFHSGGIINLLGDLHAKMTEKKNELDLENTKATEDFDRESTALSSRVAENEAAAATKSSNKAAALEAVAAAQAQKAETEKKLRHDEAYLATLTGDCELRGKQWDERTSTRAGELEALAKALAILKGTVQQLESVNLPKTSAVLIASKTEDVKDTVAAKATPAPAPKTSFLASVNLRGPQLSDAFSFIQLSSTEDTVASTPSESKKVVEMLIASAGKLKSTALYNAAMTISGDPFAKVKQLLKDLIHRLLAEGNAEATHHGWCTMNLKANDKKRQFTAERIANLQARLEEARGRHSLLDGEITRQTQEIAVLSEALTQATDLRKDDESVNAKAIKDASDAVDAVKQAMTILSEFYATAGATASKPLALLATKQAPSTWNTRYGGSQGAGGSIIEMLEVIRDNFSSTRSKTEQEEARAVSSFNGYKSQTESSIASLKTSNQNYSEEKEALDADIATDEEDLRLVEIEAQAAADELVKLKKACEDQGMTFEERSKRRLDEIAALKAALTSLGADGTSLISANLRASRA